MRAMSAESGVGSFGVGCHRPNKRPSFARSFVFDAGKPDCRLQDIPDVGELPVWPLGGRACPMTTPRSTEHRPRFGDLRLPIGTPTRNAKTPTRSDSLMYVRPSALPGSACSIAWVGALVCLGPSLGALAQALRGQRGAPRRVCRRRRRQSRHRCSGPEVAQRFHLGETNPPDCRSTTAARTSVLSRRNSTNPNACYGVPCFAFDSANHFVLPFGNLRAACSRAPQNGLDVVGFLDQ